MTKDEFLVSIINLILNPHTRNFEREQLINAKQAIEQNIKLPIVMDILKNDLRPLASRNNLTPDLTDFYIAITNGPVSTNEKLQMHQNTNGGKLERAIFAGGCFWCMVEPFEIKQGIVSVLSGYTGGKYQNPSYDLVSSGGSGHVEAVEIIFDPKLITYTELLTLYWNISDPTDAFGQFQDYGNQYRPFIFTTSNSQLALAKQSKQNLFNSNKYLGKQIVTNIQPASTFWPAENFHQEFYKKFPKRYRSIKRTRNQFLMMQKISRAMKKIFKAKK